MPFRPLISIITPTYNHERFIRQCIQSVLDQTYENWEQIIIDDGSTDRTGETVKSFRDKRIVYLPQAHRGIQHLGEAYNKALACARGDLIAVLEGDDFWPPYKLERQVPDFLGKKVMMSWGKAGLVDVESKIREVVPRATFTKDKNLWENRPPGIFLKKLLFENPIRSATVLVRKEAIEQIGGFIQPAPLPLIDYPTWLAIALRGEFRVWDTIMGYYRRYIGQVTLGNYKIWEDCASYNLSFFSTLPQPLKNSIGVSQSMLEENIEKMKVYGNWIHGRVLLSQGKWMEARPYFQNVFSKGTYKLRIKGLIGYFASIFHLDLELLQNLLGRVSFKAYK